MEFIVGELEVRTEKYSYVDSRSKPTDTEEDLSLNPNADGAVGDVGLEILHSEKEFQRDSVDALPRIGTSDPYFKFKLLVEELLIIFTKHEDRCGVCVEYILKLCKHIAETHEDYQNPTQTKFRCDICDKIYLSLIGLTRHRDIHYHSESSHSTAIQLSSSLNMYKDTVQIVSDSETSDLYFKVKLLVEELLFIFTKCEEKCGICVEYIVKLCKHMGETHEDDQNTEFTCNICGKIFVSTLELTSHHESHTNHNKGDETNETDDEDCQVVSKPFKFQRTKIQRKPIEGLTTYINYGKKRPFECNVCGKGFARRKNLKIHKLIHNSQRSFKCHVCGKSLSTKSNLKTHKLIHTGEKRFKCDECGKCFLLLGNLRVHRKRNNCKKHTMGDKKRKGPCNTHKCLTCGELFRYVPDFNKHRLIHHGIKPFKCDLCGRSFTRSANLNVHKLIHSQEKSLKATKFQRLSASSVSGTKEVNTKKYECNLCGKSFPYFSLLTTHVSSHAKERCFKCDVCGNSFTRCSQLTVHKMIHTGERPFRCSECGKRFLTKGNLNIHKYLHTGEKPFKCDECGKCFSMKANLNTHKLIHTGEKPFKCDECVKSFTSKANLNNHKLTHTGEKPFNCDECGKNFSTKAYLNNHKIIHTGEKRFNCDECGKSFLLLGYLRAHKKQNNCKRSKTSNKNRKDERKSHKCLICGELFRNANEFNIHGLTQHGVKPFKCDLCEKNFTTSYNLKAHMFIHTRVKLINHQFHCGMCGKSFLFKSRLVRHILSHTGEKTFKCDLCGKEFARSYSLKEHKITHTREKSLKCLTCGKMFSTTQNLNAHMWVHTGVKRFKCELCGRGFNFMSILARHKLSHTEERPFKCDKCERCFRTSWDLRAHTKRSKCKLKKPGDKVVVKSRDRKIIQNYQNMNSGDLHAQKSERNGEWPFKCGLCGKGFFYNCHLMKHRVKHGRPGDEPFKCDVCGKGFYYKSHLNTHRSLHSTGENPFKCGEHEKTYPSSWQIRFHKRHQKGKKTSTLGVAEVLVIQSGQSDGLA